MTSKRSPQLANRFCAAMLVVAFTLSSLPTSAQAPADSAPPYEQQLMRLSEIFGALHFLRPLCGGKDDPSWRDRMEALLEAETGEEARRRRFVERFNQGYRGFSTVYRECTSSARLAMTQYISEGEAIITETTSRYGR